MITVQTFFSGTLQTVDQVIGDFVQMAYTHVVQAHTTTIMLLFTLYVMLLGYRFLFQPITLSDCTRHCIIMLGVYGLLIHWPLYYLLVYRLFTIEPSRFATILVQAVGPTHLPQALDHVYSVVITTTSQFFSQVSVSTAGIAFIFYGFLVFAIGTAMCVFALLLFIYAKMMIAVVLALGPLFMIFVLWDATQNLFTAWLNQLMTIALIPIVTAAILVLMLSVIQVTLPDNELLRFDGLAPFLGLSLATTLILSQVFRLCSALGSGMTLARLSQGMAIAQSALEKTGITPMSRQVAGWSKRKMIKRLTP